MENTEIFKSYPVLSQDGHVWCEVTATLGRAFLPPNMRNSAGMTPTAARNLGAALIAAAHLAEEQERAINQK
jgi:hypothetical protein